jgi:ribosome maturation factor RimP
MPTFCLLERAEGIDKALEKGLKEKVRATCEAVVGGLGFEPVDIHLYRERGKLVIKVFIDKEGGVTLDECAGANELIGQVMEREDVIAGPYVLEVMSPGVNRPLQRKRDFLSSAGKRIRVSLGQTFEGKQEYSGILMSAGDESFTLDTGEEMLELGYETVSSARLDPELPW